MLSAKTQKLIDTYPEIIEANLEQWIDRELMTKGHFGSRETLLDRKERFKQRVRGYIDKYGYEMCRDFYTYWSQKNDGGKKMLYEMQKAFELSKRLEIWQKKNRSSKPAPEVKTVASMPKSYHK